VFAVLQISQCFLLEIAIDEQTLNISELDEQRLELLVVVVLDAGHFLAHAGQLLFLTLNLVLELVDLAGKVGNL